MVRISDGRRLTLARLALAALLAAACGCRAPAEAPCEDVLDAEGLATICGFAKPEDVEAVPARRVVLVSEMGWDAPSGGGSVSALVLGGEGELAGPPRRLWPSPAGPVDGAGTRHEDASCAAPPDPKAFSPHGLAASAAADGSIRVAVVAHGAREAIELFDLEGDGADAHLVWRGCLPLPTETAGNDVVFHPDGRLFVTNYIPTVHGFRALLALRRAARGEATGDVLAASPDGWQHVKGTAAAMPNGLALSSDGATLYVAENGSARIARYALRGALAAERTFISLDGAPDNLSWSRRGTLLAAVLDTRVPGAWRIEEVDPESLAVRTLFAHGGARIRAVTSAADVGGRLVLGSYLHDRVATLAQRPER